MKQCDCHGFKTEAGDAYTFLWVAHGEEPKVENALVLLRFEDDGALQVSELERMGIVGNITEALERAYKKQFEPKRIIVPKKGNALVKVASLFGKN